MRLDRRLAAAGLFGVAIALGACIAERVQWTIGTSSGGSCKVHGGMNRAKVLELCGPPTRAGDQPKRAGGPVGFCSALCDLYGESLVFYACDGGLAEVEESSGEWQQCVLQP